MGTPPNRCEIFSSPSFVLPTTTTHPYSHNIRPQPLAMYLHPPSSLVSRANYEQIMSCIVIVAVAFA